MPKKSYILLGIVRLPIKLEEDVAYKGLEMTRHAYETTTYHLRNQLKTLPHVVTTRKSEQAVPPQRHRRRRH